jgi:hypothetical protein
MRLSGPAFEVYLRSSNLAELQAVLAENQPAIVFLKTGALEHWSIDIFHTAVVIGADAMTVALDDPYFARRRSQLRCQASRRPGRQPVNSQRSSDQDDSRKPSRRRGVPTKGSQYFRR